MAIEIAQRQRRKYEFDASYFYNSKNFLIESKLDLADTKWNTSCSGCDLFICSSLHDQKYVKFVTDMLLKTYPDLMVSNKLNNSETQISTAQCLLVFLSSDLLTSSKEMEELNLIISKQRSAIDSKLMYIIQIDELKNPPTYIKLLSCETCLTDEIWVDFVNSEVRQLEGGLLKNPDVKSVYQDIKKDLQSSLTDQETIALLKAVVDIKLQLCNIRCVYTNWPFSYYLTLER